ncbi:MAG TPA: MBL fold metallo-hydrolase [Ktedonobacteraceae bacterium]|jgi:phosphoribosyl 1,2-cyclic phosphodiesterase|nr:MBL fold metallo-hydrolase [Ktedonobacteraceae bacterium]
MRAVSLASGSSGNALLIEAGPQGRTKLLVDAGIAGRTLAARLRQIGVQLSQLQGVLVTHEHSDHVVALPFLLRQVTVPVITDPRTFEAISEGIASGSWRNESGSLTPIVTAQQISHPTEDSIPVPDADPLDRTLQNNHLSLPVGASCVVGDIEITSFPTSHDAVAPCGYLLSAGGCRVCVVTDSGEVTATMLAKIQLADLLVLESNHDRQRLLRGPYPYFLKQRILGVNGHLSNDQAAEAVLRTWRADGVRWLWLSHLSRTNNSPELARKSMYTHLQQAGVNLAHIHISVSPPTMGPIWDSTQLWHTSSLWEY